MPNRRRVGPTIECAIKILEAVKDERDHSIQPKPKADTIRGYVAEVRTMLKGLEDLTNAELLDQDKP